ncbi:MAG: alpha/beta-hydrolase family protein [Candidatus Nanopelagicales bacterium]|nr:alpha/beta-hydrolase family protein [Candidatus Nanopelagicales bacterium]
MRHLLLEALAQRDLAAKSATFAAAANVGSTFAPNLLPRKPIDQAIATGASAAVTYGIANMTQSFIDGFSRRVAPGRERSRTESRKYLNTIANLTAVGVGLGLQRAFPAQRGEPVKRAAVRTLGWQVTASGLVGVGITATVGLAEEYARRRGGKLHPAVVPLGFIVGSVMSASEIVWYRRNQAGQQAVTQSLPQGLLVMGGLSALGYAETRFARLIAAGVRRTVPGLALLAEPIGHAVGLGALAGAVGIGMDYAYRQAEQGGAAIEEAYDEPPIATGVSGGPGSQITWASLSREGRRFVNMALTPDEIAGVTGTPAQAPIRAFVGLDSAPTVDARVATAMDELEKLGAFEKSVLCLCSPTGTGYINYVMAETLEYATDGDCAIVALQYSLRPSFLSLDRVKLGREQNRALLHAVHGRLMGISPDRRPRLVAFGESLGAHTLQDAFMHEGTSGLHRAGIQRALFIGTPAESKWMEQWQLDPARYDPNHEVVQVASYGEWQRLSPEAQLACRIILLTHHEDPISKFSPALMVQAPEWMSEGPGRSPALADGVNWQPFTSFVLTAVDMKNATEVVPGKFEARGHDYRADLARFTVLAFDLQVGAELLADIEVALRARELQWAEQRLKAEKRAQAMEAINRQLASWGVSDSAPGSPSITATAAGAFVNSEGSDGTGGSGQAALPIDDNLLVGASGGGDPAEGVH